MKSEKLYEVLGGINETLINNARIPSKDKKHIWLKWCAMAACLCLIAGVTLFSSLYRTPHIEDNNIDEAIEEEIDGVVEIDPIAADLAVFPENESIANVVDVSMDIISEKEAYNLKNLGGYLPTTIPEGYHFSSAGLYKTSMKDGSIYYRLSTTYSFGISNSDNSLEEETEEVMLMLDYSVSVMNYKPKTDSPIYTIDTIPDDITWNNTFTLVFDDVYLEMTSGDLTYDEIKLVLNSIQ